MKINRIASLALALLCLTGCAGEQIPADDGRLDVVTTNFALYDFARAVCGDLCDVTMLIAPGSESHDFEATLADIAVVSEADVFIYGGSEDWVGDMFASMGELADAIVSVDALEVIAHEGVDHVEGEVSAIAHDHEDEHEHNHDEMDEHVWTSIGNAQVLMDEIADAVIGCDESLAEEILANKDAYAARLDGIDAEFAALFESAPAKKIVVADRFPFAYMATRYGFAYEAAFSGCSSDTEPSLTIVNTLIETVKNEEIPAIFIIEFSDGQTAQAVADEAGCEILSLQSAHNVTKEEFDAGVTYADLMEQNLAAIRIALGAE